MRQSFVHHDFDLNQAEQTALMGCYVMGRKLGVLPRTCALGRLAAELVPNGSVIVLADAFVDAQQGRLTQAARRLETIPARTQVAAAQRGKAVAFLDALARRRNASSSGSPASANAMQGRIR